MKKTTWLWLSVIAAFFTLQVGAQNNNIVSSLFTSAENQTIEAFTATQSGNEAFMPGTPLTNGVPGLVLATTPETTEVGISYNPNADTYYSALGGSTSSPIQCHNGMTGALISTTVPNFDSRGSWWNPMTMTNEGNGFASSGVFSITNDGTCPTGGSTLLFAGNQPNSQSKGDLDYMNNEIIYYNLSLGIYRVNRVDGTVIGTTALSAVPAGADYSLYSIGYTGITGYEYALFNKPNNSVHLYDTAGAYQAEVLIATTIGAGLPDFWFSYTNDLAWIFDGTTWNSFEIFDLSAGTPPTIVCPMDIVLDASPSTCGAVVGFTAPLVSDVEDDPDPIAVQTAGLPSGSEFPVGVNTVEFSATDSDGNAVSCSFTVTINDAEAPVLTCPTDFTVSNDAGVCGAIVNFDLPIIADNCPEVVNGDIAGFTTLGVMEGSTYYVSNNTFTGADAYTDAIANGGFLATIPSAEVDAFVFSGMAMQGVNDSYIGLNDMAVEGTFEWQSGAPVSYTNWGPGEPNNAGGNEDFSHYRSDGAWNDLNGASLRTYVLEVVGGLEQTAGPASGEFFPVGTTTVSFMYTDSGGNSDTCSFEITVEDTEAPVIACEGGFMMNDVMTNGSFESGDFTGWTVEDFPTPFIPYSVLPSFDPGFGLGEALPTEGGLLAANGFDAGAPEESLLYQDVTIDAAATSVTLSWDENIDYDMMSFCAGCQDRLYEVQVRDLAGTVLETLHTVIGVGGTIENDNAWVSVSADLSAYAGQDVRVTFWQNIPEGFTGPGKFALDNVQLNVEVLDSAPLAVELDANGMATIDVLDLVTVTDNCGTVTASVPGDLICENTSNPSNAFENGYFTNPENGFIVANDLVVAADMDFELFQITANLFHDVGATITNVDFTYYEDNAGEPGAVIGSEAGITPTSQMVVGANFGFDVSETVFDLTPFTFASQVGVPTNYWISMSASSSASGIVAWEVSTASGTGDYDALNFDGTAWANPGPGSDGVYTFSGNCVPSADTTIDFTCADLGLNQVEVTVTDDAGNSSTCTATVEVLDVTDPILICQDVTIEVGPDGTTMVNPEDLLALMPSTFEAVTISSDNQSGAEGFTDFTVDVTADESVSFDWMYSTEDGPGFDSFGYLLNGVYTELTDPAGANNQSGNAAVSVVAGDVFGFRSQSADGLFGAATTVITNFMPGFNGQFEPANWTLNLDNSDGDAFFVEIPGGPLSFDACGITVLAVDVTEVTCADIGTPITATVFASDASGNIASCTSVITVVDALAPEVTCPADQTVDPGPGNLFYEVPDYLATGEATVADNCTDPVTIVSQDPAPGTLIADGVYTVTITAEDEYGNVGMCEFELTVESTLGLDDNVLDNAIALYPNPAQSQVTLANSASIALETAAIYDTNGRLINTIDLSDMQQEKLIDVSSLAAGVYMVQITSENASTVKRLVKE